MLVKLLGECFFPALVYAQDYVLGEGSGSLGKRARPRSLFFSKTAPSKVVHCCATICGHFGDQCQDMFHERRCGSICTFVVTSICGSTCKIKESVGRKRTDPSTNFSEAAIQKGFSLHSPKHNPVMLQGGYSENKKFQIQNHFI